MEEQQVLFEKREKAGIVTLNNPPANALSAEVIAEADAAFSRAIADDEVKYIILTGQGTKVFASGADIKELQGFDEAKAMNVITTVKNFAGHILECPKPTIAAINGIAFGGGLELALCCDFRVSVEKARFGLPEITLAVIPGSGGTQLLPRIVGLSKAKWMLLSGESVKSQEALEIGLIERVATEGNLLEEAMTMGDRLAANGPLAYAAIKQSLRNGMEMPFSEAMLEESKLFAKMAETEDKAEGVLAFLEKRKPEFKGK